MGIKEKIKSFPDSSGVYLMKDRRGAILYVGKASSLKRRISSYFQKPPTRKIQALLERISDIDYIQTTSSAQALLLENSLIKKHKPYYNAALKDDKSYPYIKISSKDKFPRISIVRRNKEKAARYYGPYTNAKLLKSALKSIRVIFPFRSCQKMPKAPCLYLHLKLCPGMCIGKISQDVYRKNLRQLELFLQGKYKQLLSELTVKMHQAAKNEAFEEAAALRDKIDSLTETIARTKEPHKQDILLALQKTLKLTKLPYRIEAFDVSEISGSAFCGSMVSFIGGWPNKNNYRKFRIKTVKAVDDYAMMCEILRRRYSSKELKKIPHPDLILIDGGKGHLSCAQKELKSLGLARIPVIALAKRLETIYTPGGEVLNLSGGSKVLHLLQRIRNEAHRFAISYHRKLRQKKMKGSLLDEVPGIGIVKKKALLQHFKSVEAIRKAKIEDLTEVKNIDRKAAERVLCFFQGKSI